MAFFCISKPAPWKFIASIIFLVSTFARSFAHPYACAPDFEEFPFCNTALPVEARVSDLMSRLTLKEKIHQLVSNSSAISRLGIPAYYWWSEALHGLADNGPGLRFGGLIPAATIYPQVILSAASFNRTLWNLIAQAVSTEARAMHNVGQAGLTFWSPNINIFRDPRWGRGQETPGEDPYLSSEYAVAYVSGLQGQEYDEEFWHAGTAGESNNTSSARKVAACCKHFTAYDLEEWGGYTRYTFNALVTEQDLIETYQPSFQSCVQGAQAMCVMCSYNRLNGVPNCANKQLLSQLVRKDWGLKGYITSDCDAVAVVYENSTYASSPEDAVADCLNAGMDLDCGSYVSRHSPAAIQKGDLSVSTVNNAVANLLTVRMQLGLFDGDPKLQPYGLLGPEAVCSDEHRHLALEAARQGLVLLKNEAKTLPFSTKDISKLAIIGPHANSTTDTLLGNYAGPPCANITLLESLREYADVLYEPGCVDIACQSDSLVEAAVEVAMLADAVVMFAGLDQTQESEGLDRTELGLPGQQESLISRVAGAARGAIVLVILSGGPVDVSFARDNLKIQSILWAGYPGEAGGQAIADVLFGKFCPGGRLPVTWYPKSFVEVPMTDMNMRPDSSHGYPGRTYKFYTGDTVFKFGHGLSYMEISEEFASVPSEICLPFCMDAVNQRIDMVNFTSSVCFVRHDTYKFSEEFEFNVTVRVRNLGRRAGSHTLLLFSKPSSNHFRVPQRQLIGFKRVSLKQKETLYVSFVLNMYEHLSLVDGHGKKVINVSPYVLMVNDNAQHTVHVKVAQSKKSSCCRRRP